MDKELYRKLMRMDGNIKLAKRIVTHESHRWDDFLPEGVTADDEEFFVELAEIYSRYNEDNNISRNRFRVCIFEGKEGPVPHVHVFYDRKDSKNHGKNKHIAYICLGTAEYAPQHLKETKILNSQEKKDLVKFFNTERDLYKKDNNGNLYRMTCWEEAVDRWIQNKRGSEKFFEVDENGRFIMPDYMEL